MRIHRKLYVVGGALLLAAQVGLAAAGEVSGKFVGNGKEVQLAHAVAVPHEDLGGEKAWSVVLSEQPAQEGSSPDMDATFGKLGGAVVVRVTAGGDLWGAEIYHPALESKPLSSSGTLEIEGFKNESGVLSGRLHTDGPHKFFDDTWELDVTFSAPLSGGQ